MKRVLWLVILLVLSSLRAALPAAETLPPGFTDTVVDSGFATPSALGIAPDGRIFVAEQAGTIWIVTSGVRSAQPFVTLPSSNTGDRGATGICFDPAFATNHFVYFFYTHYEPSGTSEFNCVSRFDATTDTAGPETIIFQGDPVQQVDCNGGGIGFGADGKLYVCFGNNDVDANAQSMTTTLGKVLRINNDGTIPTDNPFYGSTTGNEQAIYCLGLRNPYSMAIQPGTGVIYCNDVRGTGFDECVFQATAGENCGYPTNVGATASPPYSAPTIALPYGSSAGQSECISGGLFYVSRSAGYPASYAGLYLFPDFMNGWIETFNPSNGAFTTFATGLNSPVQMAEDASGNVYYCGISDDDLHCISYTQSAGTTTTGTTATGTTTTGTTSTGTTTTGSTATGTTTTGSTSSTGSSATTTSGTSSTTATGSTGSTPASSSSSSSHCGLGNTIGLMMALALIGVRRGLWSGSGRSVAALIRSASARSGRRSADR